MRIVNKYVLASSVFCYFGGLYLLAIKFGIMRLISQYGLHRVFNEWPENFPSLTIVWICLALYTLFFILITYWIYRANERHEKETDQLQEKTEILHNYAEQMSLIISQYNRVCHEKNITNQAQLQRLQLLQKKMAALTPTTFRNPMAVGKLSQIISELDDVVVGMKTSAENDIASLNNQLSNIVEESIDSVERLRTNSITIK